MTICKPSALVVARVCPTGYSMGIGQRAPTATPDMTASGKTKAYKIGANKAGKRFAIVLDAHMNRGPFVGTYGVWAESLNYAAHLRGGIARSWRYCKLGLSLEDAEALFARKIAGKQRP